MNKLPDALGDDIYKDGTYQSKNPTWHVEDSPWKARQIEKILSNNNIVPQTFGEVGCGAGEILIQLQKIFPGSQFSGYEVSPQAFSLSQKRESDQVHFYLKDLLEEEDAFFDVLLAIDVFEHVEDYIGFLKRLREKGDLKIFHIPLDLSINNLLRVSPFVRERESVGHLHYFFKYTAIATLEYCGYEVIDYFYTAGAVELPNRSLMNNLLKLPRKALFKINADFGVRMLGGYSLLVLAR